MEETHADENGTTHKRTINVHPCGKKSKTVFARSKDYDNSS